MGKFKKKKVIMKVPTKIKITTKYRFIIRKIVLNDLLQNKNIIVKIKHAKSLNVNKSDLEECLALFYDITEKSKLLVRTIKRSRGGCSSLTRILLFSSETLRNNYLHLYTY